MNNDELQHYGIPGMKWGVRNTRKYKTAKANYKKAKKEYFKTNIKRIGNTFVNDGFKRSEYNSSSGKKVITTQNNRNKAYTNKVTTKANLKAMTTKKENKLGYNKAEFKTYVKGLKKSGIPNSVNDRITQGQGTNLYNSITRKKGKKYADAVLQKTSKKKLNGLVVGGIATVGLYATKRSLERYIESHMK